MNKTPSLPQLWFIKVTPDNITHVQEWLYKQPGDKHQNMAKDLVCNHCVGNAPRHDGTYQDWSSNGYNFINEGHTLITTEQFMEYVYNKTIVNKQLVGYKLKQDKYQYYKQVNAICGFQNENWNGFIQTPIAQIITPTGTAKWREHNNSWSIQDTTEKGQQYYNNLLASGLLELWFEPVYEQEKQPTHYTVGGMFKVLFENNEIWHPNSDGSKDNITSFVHDVVSWSNNIIDEHEAGRFSFSVDNVVFNKTGCKQVKTTAKDWQQCWKAYCEWNKK